ncbi:MAG: sensor histidine kinase [Verrucomicrobia bacterium]|nr:sensor histidine kinase [Verrucomicrobiota bacterium]
MLQTAAEVLALPAEAAAKQIRVSLRGVVTVSEPDWQGRFFVQDASGGIYAHNVGRGPAVGDLVEAEGYSSPGAFAPVLHVTAWKKVGTAPLPVAKKITIERLMAGVEDGQRVEITGLVRSVSLAATRKIVMEVSVGGYRVRVLPKLSPQLDPQSLLAAKVTVRGTAATSFNAARRQLTAVNLFVPTVEDFVVDQPESSPPFEQPLVPLGDIARYRPNASLGERIHVRGTVTFQRNGLDLFVQDGTGGLHLESGQATPPTIGKTVEAVGFLEFVNYQPVLRDAVWREQSGRPAPLPATERPVADLRNGLHAAELIVLSGRLLDRSVRQVRRENVPFAGVRVSCTIQHPELTFTAECELTQETSPLTSVPLGSRVEVKGIASFETGDDGKLKALTLLLPDAGGLRVLEAPSWFTAERLLVGFAVVCALLAGVAAWLLTISRKNVMLSFLVAEREKAQSELQRAHDHLEARVKERTEQLQSEMTVRKTAQLEFRAVLTERTRLARELHDTLEQALTGIALQLDTAAKLFERNPRDASARLELARGFLKQSQLELRRSIWDLRSRELEQFDLAEALSIGSRQITAGSEIRVEIETEGERKPLPEIVEESLLRIGQEAVTNVVKHSGATLVTLRLTFGVDNVALEIRDNGSGLVSEQIAARGDRQFGLLGMSERAKRLGGRLDVSGSPGEGTTVRAIIPLRDPAGQPLAPRPVI